MRGGHSLEHLEVPRALIPEEIWQQGLRAVNAAIGRLLADDKKAEQEIFDYAMRDIPLEFIPLQLEQAYIFSGQDNAPITLVDPPCEEILDTLDQRLSYADILEKTVLLEETCGGSNRLAILKGTVSKLRISMGTSLLEMRVRTFWLQMNSLRRRAEADERAIRSTDPDDPPLPEAIAGLLYDLRDALNVFAAHEPKLVSLDELARDPAERTTKHANIEAARQLAEATIGQAQIVALEASQALTEATANLSGTTPADERAKEFGVKSARNFALSAIRRAYKGILAESGAMLKGVKDGAYRLIGASGVAYGTALFVKANEVAIRMLIESLGGSPSLHRIIDIIVRAVS